MRFALVSSGTSVIRIIQSKLFTSLNNKDNSSSKISITNSSSFKRVTGLVMLQLGYLILRSRGDIKISSRYSSILSIYISIINTLLFLIHVILYLKLKWL